MLYFKHEIVSSTVLSLLSHLTALLLSTPLFFAVSCNFVMAESVVKVYRKSCLPPASGQAVFKPFAEHGPVRAPAATYLSQRKHESQATSISVELVHRFWGKSRSDSIHTLPIAFPTIT